MLATLTVAAITSACAAPPSMDAGAPAGSSTMAATPTSRPEPTPGRTCTVPGSDQTKPRTVSGAGLSPTQLNEVGDAQTKLPDQFATIRQYGQSHPSEWTGTRWEPDHPERVEALFTANIETHRAALASLVSEPTRVDVHQSCYTKADLDAVLAAIRAEPGVGYLGVGGPLTAVDVALTAQGETYAEQLWHRYGDALSITVGAFAYPPSRADPTRSACPADIIGGAPGPETTVPGLELTLTLEPTSVVSGANFGAKLTARNTGTTPIRRPIEGQPLTGMIVDPGTRHVVGSYTGMVTGTGATFSIPPNGHQVIDVLVGTASCDLDKGYAVPPGTYGVVVPVQLPDTTPITSQQPIPYLLSPEAPLTITAS